MMRIILIVCGNLLKDDQISGAVLDVVTYGKILNTLQTNNAFVST